jgi:hypothetical protein
MLIRPHLFGVRPKGITSRVMMGVFCCVLSCARCGPTNAGVAIPGAARSGELRHAQDQRQRASAAAAGAAQTVAGIAHSAVHMQRDAPATHESRPGLQPTQTIPESLVHTTTTTLPRNYIWLCCSISWLWLRATETCPCACSSCASCFFIDFELAGQSVTWRSIVSRCRESSRPPPRQPVSQAVPPPPNERQQSNQGGKNIWEVWGVGTVQSSNTTRTPPPPPSRYISTRR